MARVIDSEKVIDIEVESDRTELIGCMAENDSALDATDIHEVVIDSHGEMIDTHEMEIYISWVEHVLSEEKTHAPFPLKVNIFLAENMVSQRFLQIFDFSTLNL